MLHLFGPSLEVRVYMNYKFYAMFVCVNNEVARLGQSIPPRIALCTKESSIYAMFVCINDKVARQTHPG